MTAISSLQRNKLLSLAGNLLVATRTSCNVDMVQTMAMNSSGLKLSRWFVSLGTSSKFIQQSGGMEKPKLDLKSSMKYCMDQVKEHDYENYLWSTQLPVVCLNAYEIVLHICNTVWYDTVSGSRRIEEFLLWFFGHLE